MARIEEYRITSSETFTAQTFLRRFNDINHVPLPIAEKAILVLAVTFFLAWLMTK